MRIALIAGLVLGCGVSGEPPSTFPPVTTTAARAGTATGPPRPPPGAAELPNENPPASAQTRRETEVADTSTPRPIVLLPSYVEAPLFSDEVARLGDTIARRLEANKAIAVSVIPSERLDALKAVAAAGKLRADGPRCAAAPTMPEVVTAAHPGLLVGRISLLCSGEQCNAHYAVYEEPYREHTSREGKRLIEGFAAPKDPTSEADWKAAVGALDAEPTHAGPSIGGGLLGELVAGGDGSVRVRAVQAFHFQTPVRASAFDAEASAATKACKSPMEYGSVLMSVGADGKVSRCEDRDGSCYCAAFSRHLFDSGPSERRVLIRFSHRRALGWRGDVGGLLSQEGGEPAVVQMGTTYDEPLGARAPREKALAACFGRERADARFDVSSRLDERGTVVESTLSEGAEALTAQERDCVLRAAKKFVYRCPDRLGDSVWGRYSFHAARRGGAH